VAPDDDDPARPGTDGREPVVSVGIPTYNRIDRLAIAVESVLAQDHRLLEVIISDNASTDGTEEYCRGLADREPRVRYVRNRENIGPMANFRQVHALSTGDYFMWLGDDDWIDSNYVSACLDALRSDPGASLAVGSVIYQLEDGSEVPGQRVELLADGPSERVTAYWKVVRENGTLYGLMPRWVISNTTPLLSILGNDMYLLAETAFLGRFRVIDDVVVHRGAGISMTSLRAAARSAGFSRFEVAIPQLAITVSAFREIAWRSPVYRPLGRVSRVGLAAHASWITLRRFPIEGVVRVVRRKLAGWRGRPGRGASPPPVDVTL
jgi:glycosyltransferase involved in cell wall biosynthesis